VIAPAGALVRSGFAVVKSDWAVSWLALADGWDDRWVKSKFKSSDEGPWELSAGKYYGDADNKGNYAPCAAL
jgi:hypothetical protein